MRRKYNEALIPDRAFVATIYYTDGASLTTTIHAPNVTAAEDPSRYKSAGQRPIARIVVRSEMSA